MSRFSSEPTAGLSEAVVALRWCGPAAKAPQFLAGTIAPQIPPIHRPGIAATPAAVPDGLGAYERRGAQFRERRVPTNLTALRPPFASVRAGWGEIWIGESERQAR